MGWSPDPQSLRGRIAVVAGATRGAGRGIALGLGEAGATVICTGRSTRALGSSRSDYNRAETIDELAKISVNRLAFSQGHVPLARNPLARLQPRQPLCQGGIAWS